MTRKLFISYAHSDQALVPVAINRLQKVGLLDPVSTIFLEIPIESRPEESDSRATLMEQIKMAGGMILIWSKQAATSSWVQYELGVAQALNIPVLIVVTDAIAPTPPTWMTESKVVQMYPELHSDMQEYREGNVIAYNHIKQDLVDIWTKAFGQETANSIDLSPNPLLVLQILSHIRNIFRVFVPINILLKAKTLDDLAEIIIKHKQASGEMAELRDQINAEGQQMDDELEHLSKAGDSLVTLNDFGVDQWCEWLNGFLSSELSIISKNLESLNPGIKLYPDELHTALIKVYSNLQEKRVRDKFAEAVVRVYESTPVMELNTQFIYYLLQVIAYIKPLLARRILRRQLFAGVLIQFQYRGLELHNLLLVAVGSYDVDNDVIDYIYQSAEQIKDPSYLLVAFRVLASAETTYAFPFIEKILPLIESDVEARGVEFQLRVIFSRFGYRGFYYWFCDNAKRLSSILPKEFSRFKYGLIKNLLPIDWESSSDEHLALLGRRLSSNEQD